MTEQHTILIVEDELKIAQLLSDYLIEAGYKTSICNDGNGVVELIESLKPACVLLDVMLPVKDGLTICKEVRQFSMVPVVMITARVDEIDRLLGLELGADDYICKPFSPREVVIRVRNILRRVELLETAHNPIDEQEADQGTNSSEYINYRNLKLDQEKFSCHLQEISIALTAVEFRMLFAMANRPGCVFSRDQLMKVAYTDGRIVSDRTIDTHVKNMRKKLVQINDDQNDIDELIHSIYGVGYKVE